MSEPLSTEPYKGVRDFYPADWAKLEAVFGVARDVLTRAGFEEYNASPLERAELYEAKTSEEIVNEQTYTFTDRGDRRVTLRPEMTPTLARMVAAKRRELTFPLRWFSIGNRFRYERPQKGRLREFYQIDVDLIGIEGAQADGEVIVLAANLLKAFGASEQDFVIRLNSRALLDAAAKAAGLTPDQTKAYLRLLDKKAKMPAAEFAAALGAIAAADPLERIEAGLDEDVRKEKERLAGLIEAFRARGMKNVVFDPSIVRGFDYYTGVVFEIYDTNPENPRALFGGGRYDNLLTLFGGERIPAIGFAAGDVTLIDFLTTHDLMPRPARGPELYLGTVAAEDLAFANEAADALRTQGLRVFVNISGRALGEQVREADKRGIPFFAAIGSNEKASRVLSVKRLSIGEERALALADIAPYVRS